MVKLLSPSFFTRLYLTIATAVVVSGTLTFFAIDSLDQQNEIDEVLLDLKKNNQIEKLTVIGSISKESFKKI